MRAGVEQLGDVGMVHQRDGLPLGLEAGEDRPGLAPLDADQLDRDPALDGLGLVGHPDRAHAPLADLLEQLVAAGDERAGGLGGGPGGCGVGGRAVGAKFVGGRLGASGA